MGPWTFIYVVGLAFLVWFVLVFLFTPRIDYHLTGPLADEAQLLRVLQEECQARLHAGNCAAVLTNGTQFYPAMLAAIREAHHSINVEAYIFEPGEIVDQVVAALAERAKAGVEVRIVLDAIGSSHMRLSAAASRLTEAGCRLRYYQRLTWYRLHRANNRTHRELLIVDGRVAFVGGAGVADWWYRPSSPRNRRGATRWCGSRDRWWRRSRACSPRTGSNARARFSPRHRAGRRSEAPGRWMRCSSAARPPIAPPRRAWAFSC